MYRLHIVGGKNHGKTTLIEQLVPVLRSRGCRVGTIKHTHHRHELDTPGKDSFRHRQAGADPVAVLSRNLLAVYVSWHGESSDSAYAQLAPFFGNCQLVLVEGDSGADAPKVEVWRATLGTPPKAVADPAIQLIVTDDPISVPTPVLPRSNLTPVVDWILERVRLSKGLSLNEFQATDTGNDIGPR